MIGAALAAGSVALAGFGLDSLIEIGASTVVIWQLKDTGRVTLVDAYLAAVVLLGLILTATLGWWWADPLAGQVIVYYALRERRGAPRPEH